MHKLHRLSKNGNVDDARECGRAIEGCWRVIAFHPNLLPTVHAHPDGAAHHLALEQLVSRKDEHPLRGEAGGVEYGETDVGDASADHDVDKWGDRKWMVCGCQLRMSGLAGSSWFGK